jgi:translation initiation factor 2 subunit 1
VHSLLRHIAQVRHVKLEDLYKQIAWPLARQFGHAYEAFKLAIIEPDKVFASLPDIAPDLKELLQKEILERLTPQAVRVRADVEVTCFAYAGIDAVKAALRAAIAVQTEHMPVKVKLLAPPHYVMWCAAIDKEAGIELLEKAISQAEAVIKKNQGDLVVKIAPRAVTEREDAELTRIDDSDDDSSDGSD